MTMVTILAPDGSEQQAVDDTHLDAYPGWTVVAQSGPTDDHAVLTNGVWAVPLSVLKTRKKAAVMQTMGQKFYAGFTVATVGPLQGHVLQVRDDTDRTNWLTSKDRYRDEIANGQGDVANLASFRTEDNTTITCTYNQGFAVLQDMGAWGTKMMTNSWSLKDHIDAAADEATLNAIDITLGWS